MKDKTGKGGKHRKDRVTVQGACLPVSLAFLRSRAFAELSPHAKAMLFDLCAMLGANANRNGDLSAAPRIMRARGWTSNATRIAALKELESAQLIVITRRGNRGRCALYAVTLWPLQCDLSKLEVKPGAYSTSDLALDAHKAAAPTAEQPATWRGIRQIESACPDAGKSTPTEGPAGGKVEQATALLSPTKGSRVGLPTAKLVPLGDTYLDSHLPVAVGRTPAFH